MSSDAWQKLKGTYRAAGLAMACGQPAIPKTSRLGLQFFAHTSGAECPLHTTGPETPEHLEVKAAVARAARSLGWEAAMEFPAADRSWIADVMVTHGERRIAVEVQWSRQPAEEFARRQKRYTAAGISCFWLVAEVNAGAAAQAAVPFFVLEGEHGGLRLRLPSIVTSREVPVEDGVREILHHGFRRTAELIAREATVITSRTKCWRAHCGANVTLWRISKLSLRSRCGRVIAIRWENWTPWAKERHEQFFIPVVQRFLDDNGFPGPAGIRVVHSRTTNSEYAALTCPACGTFFGDGLTNWDTHEKEMTVPITGTEKYPLASSTMAVFPDSVAGTIHVCRDVGFGKCQGRSPKAHPKMSVFPPAREPFEAFEDISRSATSHSAPAAQP